MTRVLVTCGGCDAQPKLDPHQVVVDLSARGCPMIFICPECGAQNEQHNLTPAAYDKLAEVGASLTFLSAEVAEFANQLAGT